MDSLALGSKSSGYSNTSSNSSRDSILSTARMRISPNLVALHLLTCMIDMTALRLLELKLGDKYTSRVIMEEMHALNCVLTWAHRAQKP